LLILNQIFNLVKLINSETGKWQIAFGFAIGMILGFLPGFGIHTVVLFFLLCILRINLGAAILSWAFFGIAAYPLDPLFHKFGYYLLVNVPSLQGIWTKLYNLPVWPWTRFNNTVMMGSFAVAIIAFIPAVIIFGILIQKYRETVRQWILNSKIYKALKTTTLYSLYEKYQSVKGMVAE
jgi:uncharacterized protein (TIGR03546 family)